MGLFNIFGKSKSEPIASKQQSVSTSAYDFDTLMQAVANNLPNSQLELTKALFSISDWHFVARFPEGTVDLSRATPLSLVLNGVPTTCCFTDEQRALAFAKDRDATAVKSAISLISLPMPSAVRMLRSLAPAVRHMIINPVGADAAGYLIAIDNLAGLHAHVTNSSLTQSAQTLGLNVVDALATRSNITNAAPHRKELYEHVLALPAWYLLMAEGSPMLAHDKSGASHIICYSNKDLAQASLKPGENAIVTAAKPQAIIDALEQAAAQGIQGLIFNMGPHQFPMQLK